MVRTDSAKERANAGLRRRHVERIASGVCTRCGKAQPEPGLKMCRDCGDKRRAADRARRARARAEGKPYRGRDPIFAAVPTAPGTGGAGGRGATRALLKLRPQPSRERPIRLRAVPRGTARHRPPALCLAALPVPVCAALNRPSAGHRAAPGTPRWKPSASRPSARKPPIANGMPGAGRKGVARIAASTRQARALSRLRAAVQYPRACVSQCAGRAALLHRDRAGYRGGSRHLRTEAKSRPASPSPGCAPTRWTSAPTCPSWRSPSPPCRRNAPGERGHSQIRNVRTRGRRRGKTGTRASNREMNAATLQRYRPVP